MPATIIGASGTPYAVPNLAYDVVRTILLEKVTTGLPAGVTRASGNPPAWIEFATPATDYSAQQGGVPGGGAKFSINPNNVESVQPA